MTQLTPDPEKYKPVSETECQYTVVSGDSLWKIARNLLEISNEKKKISNKEIANLVDKIAHMNRLDEKPRCRDLIYPDEKLLLPLQTKKDS